MKYLIFTLAFTVFSAAFCQAQSFENQKMLTTTFRSFSHSSNVSNQTSGSNPTQTSRSSNFSIGPQITYGKVNSRNELIAYGVSLDFSNITSESNNGVTSRSVGFGASPMMVIQKFIRISDVFYLTPSVIGMAGYFQGRLSNSQTTDKQITRQFNSSISLIPVSITYVFKPKLNLVFSLGQITMGYSYRTISNEPNLSDFKNSQSNLSYVGNITGLRLGFQILL